MTPTYTGIHVCSAHVLNASKHKDYMVSTCTLTWGFSSISSEGHWPSEQQNHKKQQALMLFYISGSNASLLLGAVLVLSGVSSWGCQLACVPMSSLQSSHKSKHNPFTDSSYHEPTRSFLSCLAPLCGSHPLFHSLSNKPSDPQRVQHYFLWLPNEVSSCDL